MKFFIYSLLLFIILGIFSLTSVLVSPYYFYAEILKGESFSPWYIGHKDIKHLFAPDKEVTLIRETESNPSLWQSFQMKDVVISLPVKNPFYDVVPVLDSSLPGSVFGLSFYGTGGREIAKVFFTQNIQFFNQVNAQELFKLPIIKKEIMTYKQDDLWTKVFSKKIEGWKIPFSEMIENLYILELRKKILPEKIMDFALFEGGDMAHISIESQNKDFNYEQILTKNKGLVYSMIIYTRKDDLEALNLKNKVLSDLSFRPSTKSLGRILQNEFMALPLNMRTDQAGMLYLLSAWSHDPEMNYVKEMIEFLERGASNQRQLDVLYRYAFEKFGKTFSRKRDTLKDGNLKLHSEIEIEERESRIKEEELSKKDVAPPELSNDEKYNQMLKNIKSKKKKVKKDEVLFN